MRIVAFVDPSLYAQSVLEHTIWLARENGASVDLVQIVSPNEMMVTAPMHPGGFMLPSVDKSIDGRLVEARKQLEEGKALLGTRDVRDVRIRVIEGPLSQHMIEAAAGADILVMGKRGEHADLARLHLGSNFERMVRASGVPVLAVSRMFRPVQRALVAFNAGPGGENAVEAMAMGIIPKMPVRIFHAGDDNEPMHDQMGLAAARLANVGYETATEVVAGDPSAVVPERVVSAEIDLLAMGSFGSSRLKSMILGSLTSDLIRGCQVPVLLC